jgi:hypothetical protein
MYRTRKLMLSGLIAAGIAAPLLALAAIVPIGGKVISVLPCKTGGYTYQVAGFGVGTGLFWYMPGTPTFLYGPPIMGKWVLGMGTPGGCGFPTTMIGSSPAI